MNRPEFDRWWDDFKLRFPTTVNWIAADTRPEQLRLMINTWAQSFETTDVADALEVNRRVQSGDLDDWGRNSDKIPATVRRHASGLYWERRSKSDIQDDPDRPIPPRGINGLRFGEMFTYVSEAVRQNVPKEIWLPEGLRRLGDVPDHRQQRVRCVDCRDTGFFEVWSNAAIAAFKAGVLAEFKGRMAVAGCPCRSTREKIPTYDHNQHVICQDGGKSERDQVALGEFLQGVLPFGGREFAG